MSKGYFVTGIGTDVGKTVVSAILVSALKADYWKPVQAGDLNNTDSHKIASYCAGNFSPVIHRERYLFTSAMSPHAAAKIDKVVISPDDFTLPASHNPIIVEGAGGLLVPLNETFLVADLAAKLKLPVIVVSRIYLGSINHTLLTIDALKARKIEVAGIIFNGEENRGTQESISEISGTRIIARIPEAKKITPDFIREQGSLLAPLL